ncbi:60S ribosomal subunit assembly/export protein [Alternaria novae-zelandiae]|uniref:60S ribosomal subunit assembly/export protein n=1 Tax=Alternaria metachromatica TaxID=283354 RepID=UPI0020C55D33|nr:60S ribosomal subunit assembly/export protein [Alternaria metachromatica]XP_049201496.1 60S ribosomal subunit assembly/export protein [Alternaria ventricosa]XP_049206924.1 60S ribosomal subunit assembly/export protein [Alternaria viburni]XP_049227836.1 60S ribosomal subunit assembly/export protein [Alternaria ethzedia]XP_049238634.1 60S ribosomal subunit assembly/export protein [Alternaria hordeiaustralica]XP_049257548.1 60S ribosomal subunit assembly/export protein [Alternaria novae-zeland
MGLSKPSTKGKTSSKGKSGPAKSGANKPKAKSAKPTGSAPEGISKRKQKSMSLAKPGGQQKTKSVVSRDGRKKKRVYTEKELDIPALNGIIPAGIAKPKGVKKGKKFVDDPASMMAIMSVVNAEKEGHLESKIAKARQLEEIREAKRKEAEARKSDKDQAFEERKQDLKKKRKRHSEPGAGGNKDEGDKIKEKDRKFKQRKRVSFG